MLYDAAINLLDVLDHNAEPLYCSCSTQHLILRERERVDVLPQSKEEDCAPSLAVVSLLLLLLHPPWPRSLLVTWLNDPSAALSIVHSALEGREEKAARNQKNLVAHLCSAVVVESIDRSTTLVSVCVCVLHLRKWVFLWWYEVSEVTFRGWKMDREYYFHCCCYAITPSRCCCWWGERTLEEVSWT